MKFHRSLIPLAVACGLTAPLAGAQEAAPLPPGMADAEVLAGWQRPDGARIAAVRIALREGWKTYWRSPGDAGIPPQFDFAGSDNVAGVTVHWPTPEIFDQNGMRSVGYDDVVVLPLEIHPTDPSRPVRLNTEMDIGICHDICVPVSVGLHADLDGPGAPDPAIRTALTEQPPIRREGASCSVEPIADGMRVTARIDLPPGPGEIALFELKSTPMWVSDSVMHREGGALVASAEFVPEEATPFALDKRDLRITVLSGAGAVEFDGCLD